MTTLSISKNQNQLLMEIINLIPKYDGIEVLDILKTTINSIRKCKKAVETSPMETEMKLSPEVASLIGIVPKTRLFKKKRQ